MVIVICHNYKLLRGNKSCSNLYAMWAISTIFTHSKTLAYILNQAKSSSTLFLNRSNEALKGHKDFQKITKKVIVPSISTIRSLRLQFVPLIYTTAIRSLNLSVHNSVVLSDCNSFPREIELCKSRERIVIREFEGVNNFSYFFNHHVPYGLLSMVIQFPGIVVLFRCLKLFTLKNIVGERNEA